MGITEYAGPLCPCERSGEGCGRPIQIWEGEIGMDRQALIDYICAKGHDSRPVLEGLETEHLERIKVWYESKADRDKLRAVIRDIDNTTERERKLTQWLEKTAFPYIAGERQPHNVYLIEWEDGYSYVGKTSKSIMERMEGHFKHIDLGLGNYEFVMRYQVGIGYRFRCLHTGLDQHGAWRKEIAGRRRLLNEMYNKNPHPTPPPLTPEQEVLIRRLKEHKIQIAENSAVARIFEKG